MPAKELKICPRCNKKFECHPGNIVQCQCYGIVLSAEQKAWIKEKHHDCLCKNCLEQLAKEPNPLKERYTFR